MKWGTRAWGGLRGVVLAGWILAGGVIRGQDIERPPICYSTAEPRNVVSRLVERLERGEVKLHYEPEQGYLRSLLEALDLPVSSQVLVFSKTSLQRERIAPATPRAIYFNDQVFVGYCQGGRVMEISVVDEAIGTAFYTLDQRVRDRPRITRQTDTCLICHSSSANQGYPGHLVRSLYVDGQGLPILSAGSFRTDHTSPLEERWGGWYVTGKSGRQKHMGNLICSEGRAPRRLPPDGVNVTDLAALVDLKPYPAPHSDIVALMVLEHQAGMLNRLARAALETRMALDDERELNRALGEPLTNESPSARSRIRNVAEAVVDYMLFKDETVLTDPIEGTAPFAVEFARRGKRDAQGRSLREFDLKRRLFRYPCSYLIDSPAFEQLPGVVKQLIYTRLWQALQDLAPGSPASKYTAAERQAVIEIVRAIKNDLPPCWRDRGQTSGP